MENNDHVIPAKAGIYECQESQQIPAFAGMTQGVYLSLGSNVDDRMTFMMQAQEALSTHPQITVGPTSKIYETEPWPKEENEQKWFLNQVIKIETSLSPPELMALIKSLEEKIGRIQTQHWGPREIDIDILLYGDQIIDEPELQIPHRHMADRQFVLVPLVELAPDLAHPMTGRRFSDMLEEVQEGDSHRVVVFL